MIYAKGSYIFTAVAGKLRALLLKETTLSPPLYFLLFVYFHYPFEAPLTQLPFLLYLFAVVVALTAKFNFLFTLAPWAPLGAAMAVPMLGVSLLSCTEKWKMYLFLLAVGDSAFTSASQQYFLAIFSFLICCEIYRTFIFRTVSQNTQYFVGMAAICIYYILTILYSYLGSSLRLEIHLILVIAASSLAHAFIQLQARKITRADPKYIYSGRLMAHYLRAMEETANDIPLLRTHIRSHSRTCFQANCFCQSKDHGEQVEYLMRQLYENALERFKGESDSLLLENYVQFLLRNGQAINALHFLSEWQPQGYFSVVGHERARGRVERQLREANSSNLYELQYEYALEYDQQYQRMAVEINAILKLKLQFWREVSKETPRVSRMQTLGDEIVAKMYDLNLFYSKVIRLERSLFLFDATALYAMYMLSTTNFNEYSELIIKNTAKLLEEVYLLDSGSSETFAIRTVVRRSDTSFVERPEDGLKPLRRLASSHSFMDLHENGCKLIIDAVSEGLCKVVGVRRSELVGQELNSIIPQGYKEVHNVRLSYLLNFETESLQEIVQSKVMHKELKLPMKCNNEGLAMAYVCIKFLVDPKEGLTFVSVVKLARDRSSYVLMDFGGRITESEDGFNKEILAHSQIQRYLQRLRQTWEDDKIIPEQRFNLMINTANYSITISSPLLGLFLQKENLKQKCPPIHLEITNQENTRNRTLQAERHNKVGIRIQQMEKAINVFDVESSSSTSKSGSSAVSVINSFSEAGSHPLYRLLQLAFLVSILTCFLSNLAAFLVTDLPWDPSVPTRNPLNDTMNLYALQMLTIKAVLILGDEINYFQTSSVFNRTRVSRYFGGSSYEVNMAQVTANMEAAFKDSIRHTLATPSKLLQPYINQRLNTPLAITPPISVAQMLNVNTYQNITYLDLLMIYASDLNLMSRFDVTSPTLGYSFTIPVATTQNCSFLSPIIDKAVQSSQFLAIAVHIGLMFVIALLIIPSYLLLKRRISLHQKVFDLMASIDAEQVACEIRSLQHVANILRNSKESSEIMKMNVVDYQENMLHPKGSKRASSDNEMVLGLEKYDTSQQNYDLTLQKYTGKTPPSVAHLSSQPKLQTTMQSTGSQRGGSFKQTTLLGIIKESYLSTQAEQSQNRRKRSGELQLAGSELDPARRAIGEHCLLYLISLSFLIVLGLSIHFKLNFDSQYLQGKDELIRTYTEQISFELELVTAKIVFQVGTQFFGYFFGTSNPLGLLVSMINQTPTYNYNDGLHIYSEIIPNCTASAPLPAAFIAKYCQYDYSEVLLKGEFGSLFKQLIEMRYLVDTAGMSPTANTTAILQNITEKVYYLQSLNIRLEELVLMKVNMLFEALGQLGEDYSMRQEVMLVASGVWGILCFVVGWGVIVRLKRSYFRQVFMITFLNSEMILRNKRVESFLDALAKNIAT